MQAANRDTLLPPIGQVFRDRGYEGRDADAAVGRHRSGQGEPLPPLPRRQSGNGRRAAARCGRRGAAAGVLHLEGAGSPAERLAAVRRWLRRLPAALGRAVPARRADARQRQQRARRAHRRPSSRIGRRHWRECSKRAGRSASAPSARRPTCWRSCTAPRPAEQTVRRPRSTCVRRSSVSARSFGRERLSHAASTFECGVSASGACRRPPS
jgi:hypothetical protein